MFVPTTSSAAVQHQSELLTRQWMGFGLARRLARLVTQLAIRERQAVLRVY